MILVPVQNQNSAGANAAANIPILRQYWIVNECKTCVVSAASYNM